MGLRGHPSCHQLDEFGIGLPSHFPPNLRNPRSELGELTECTKSLLCPQFGSMTEEFLPAKECSQPLSDMIDRIGIEVECCETSVSCRALLARQKEPPYQTIRKCADVHTDAKGVLEHLIQMVIKLLPRRLHLDKRNHMGLSNEGDVDSTLLALATGVVLKLDSVWIGLIPSESRQRRQDRLYFRALLVGGHG